MRALLLSAGLGTRLQPLTHSIPKCLVPINGRPLLDYWLDNLVSHGIEHIIVNTHYHAALVTEYVTQSSWRDHVTLIYEDKLLGTAGTALANRELFFDKPFLIAHADNLTRFNCAEFINTHKNRPAGTVLTMMLFQTSVPKSCGIVSLDEQGIVKEFYEKVDNPPSNLANAAVYIVEPCVVDFMASLKKSEIDFSTEVIPYFMGQIATFLNSTYHRDIGNVASWAEAQRDFGMPPALPHNAKVWNKLMNTLDPDLPNLMNELAMS